MFRGTYNHTIDPKGRLSIPSKFRDILGDEFVISKGLDGCLYAYAMEDWEAFEANLSRLSLTNEDARQFARYFMSGAQDVTVDKQGRILMPQDLRNHAGLDKDVVLAGLGKRIEIWSQEKWEAANDRIDINKVSKSLSDMNNINITI